MYKYLLCWRYLRTRYIALASVISVMLGVATMIVVNSVMAGFSDKMRDRLHGVLADSWSSRPRWMASTTSRKSWPGSRRQGATMFSPWLRPWRLRAFSSTASAAGR